jgi:hypothetical protein
MQRKLDAAAAVASAAASAAAVATPSAAADPLVDGGDDEHKRRLREKAEQKMQKLQKLQQEADQQAAAASVAAPASGDCENCNMLCRVPFHASFTARALSSAYFQGQKAHRHRCPRHCTPDHWHFPVGHTTVTRDALLPSRRDRL